MNILLVDHTTIYRDILQQALCGFVDLSLTYANDAAEARTLLPGREFHFIIVSRHLPDIDGVDFIRELRSSGQFMFEPIVLLTSSPSSALAAVAEHAGVTEIFRKHDIDELVSFLQRFLGVYTPLRGRILYVEDARDQRQALEAQLRSWNLQVDAFDSAEAAWDAFRNHDYDLLICDVVLQGRMTGSRLVNRIRRTAGRKGDIPILAITAFDSTAKRIELFHVGIDDYINKPVILVELHARIHGILSRKLVADRNRALIDASSLAVLLTDERGLITSANAEAAHLFGCGSDNFTGLDIRQFLPQPDCQNGADLLLRFGIPLDKAGAHGLPWDTLAQRRNGETVPIRFSVIETASFGIRRQFAVIVRDVSNERLMAQSLLEAKEHAEAATRLKSQFLANMSHEIRTPMNGILGMMQLALDGQLPTRERGYISKAYESAHFLLGVLDDILDLSKIEAGKLDFDLQAFDLEQLLTRLRDLFGIRAVEKGIVFRVDRTPGTPTHLIGDQLRLAQVLNNLLSNALKFTRHGSVELEIRRGDEDFLRQRVQLLFAVRDTGIGITAPQLEQLFQPFCQAEVSTSREFGGSGLGLVICRHLVERMDGTMTVNSTPGQGSVFSFSAWFELADPQTVASLPQSGDNEHACLQGRHVLVVEDNPVNQELVSQHLQQVGMVVDTALNGQEAVECIRSAPNRYHAVLMDMQMPVMDGVEATRIVRLDRIFNALPIIALTANAMPEDRQRCFAAGMQDYISKPIDRDLLYATLVKWCAARPAPITAVPTAPSPRPVEPPPTASSAPAGDFPLPELDGLPQALKRMGNDYATYRFMYREVLNSQSATPEKLRAALATNDWAQVRRLAHTLKGLASTLGATPLRTTTELLEHCCLTPDAQTGSDCQVLVDGIETGLKRLHELAEHPLVSGDAS